MVEHLAVVAAIAPIQFLLGAANTRARLLTRGEVRFWCVVLFVAAELVTLGVSS